MSIRTELEENLKTAMKAHDEEQKRVLRMALSSIKFLEKEQGKTLEDDQISAVLQKEIKIRKETMSEAQKGGRDETVSELQNEIRILEAYLPKQLSQDELEAIIKEAISETAASQPSDMGKVMKAVMPKVKGLAANDIVSKTVKDLLGN